MRRWATEVRADLVSNVVQPGRFTNLEYRLTLHIRERLPNGQLLGILIDDQRNPKERMNPEQLIKELAKSGVNAATLKHRIKADIVWPQLVRGRYQASLQIGEKDLVGAKEQKSDDTGYDYYLRPILFLIPPGSPEGFIDTRRRDAESLRARFQGCDEGLALARALKDVAVREQVVRSSADLPLELRKVLDGIEVGKLTPPELTKFGIEMHAMGG